MKEENFLKGKTRADYELLMPAGDMEKAKYAIAFGADAIYCGIPMFTLRGKSSMNLSDVAKIIPYAHKRGVKVYLAVNIFPHSFKYEQFMIDMKKMVDMNPDAFIMADPGLIDLTLENFPEAEVHLSVQANNVNWKSVEFWHKQGVKRVILSRELSLEEIKEIREKVPTVELEVFVHGAICMAYSGRCLLSNYMAHRDPNQGSCVQSCRFKYKLLEEAPDGPKVDLLNKNIVLEEEMRPGQYMPISEDSHGTYLMNPRDLCLLPYLKDLAEAGVHSIKIEGRSKTVYYVACVCRMYRKALDDLLAGRDFDESLMEEAYKIASRGYTPGFLFGDLGKYSMRYEKSSPIDSAKFIGILGCEVKSGEYMVDVRNRVGVGSEIEVVMPDEVCKAKIKALKDLKGAELDSVHGGAGDRVFVIGKKGLSGGLVREVVGHRS